jgi:carboxymethylenebutenolidase
MTTLRPDGTLETFAPLNRRLALGAMGAGFALALQPVAASTISTSGEGLIEEDIEFKVDWDHAPAFVARPAGDGPYPVVILVSEIFGVHEHIRDVARRLAKAGYCAIAPDYFFRAGNPAEMEDFQEILKIVRTATNDQVMGDTANALTWAANKPFADTERVGITGFCWGGAVTWMASAQIPQIKAGVAWYGRLRQPDGWDEARPWPVDIAGDLKAPVLGLYAENDRGIPLEDVDAMRAALAAAGNGASEIVVYEDAQHGFHADYRASYKADAAKDGWSRMLAWFAAHGVD